MNGIKRRDDKEVRKRQNKNQYLVAGLRVPGDAGDAGDAGLAGLAGAPNSCYYFLWQLRPVP